MKDMKNCFGIMVKINSINKYNPQFIDFNNETMKDTIVEQVRQDLLDRSEVGIRKYNTTLDRDDLSIEDWVEHARQEAMDFSLYLTRLKKDIVELQNQFDEVVRECINLKHELQTKDRIIENLNKVILSQEQEIKEFTKEKVIVQKRRAWHI